MKVKYIGQSFGAFGLTDGKIYICTEVDKITGALRIIDDEGLPYWDDNALTRYGYEKTPPGYLYSPTEPRPCFDETVKPGKFEIIEDDEQGTLQKAIFG